MFVQQFIASYSYGAVFLLMAAESACIPVPSELIMLFGGALAAEAGADDHRCLILITIAGVAGNVVGSYVAWAVGRYGGPAVWHRWGKYVLLRGHDLDRAEHWFARYVPPQCLSAPPTPFPVLRAHCWPWAWRSSFTVAVPAGSVTAGSRRPH
ncbi:DedA family protein [Mycobacterium sp.]|uniref:DedA family protein n=1 Tax=Mycobacterium sp. TaxID=1785 RepID=UPI003D6C4FDB